MSEKVTDLKDMKDITVTRNENGTYAIKFNATIHEDLLNIDHNVNFNIPKVILDGKIITDTKYVVEDRLNSTEKKVELNLNGRCLANGNSETITFSVKKDKDKKDIKKEFKNINKFYTFKEYIQNLVKEASKKYNVSENLISAIIEIESDYKNLPVDSIGNMGVMQVSKKIAENNNFKNVDLMDIPTNINAGTAELARDLKAFNGTIPLALAAYNAGIDAVKEYGGIPPYKETQNYINKILNLLHIK